MRRIPLASSVVLFLFTVLAYQNCGQLRSNSIQSANLPVISLDEAELVQTGKTLYGQQCAGCHGPFDSSDKLGRNAEQIIWAVNNVPQMENVRGLTAEQANAIAAALIFQANGGDVEENTEGRLQYTCDPNIRTQTPIRRLNNREFRNSIFAVLDHVQPGLRNDAELNRLLGQIPSDLVLESDHTRKERSTLLNQNISVALFEVSYRTAALIAGSTSLANLPGTNGCLSAATLTSNCHRLLVRELGSLAFRRPLSNNEQTEMATRFWDAGLSRAQLIQLTVAGLLHAPDFLYQVYDQGQAVAGSEAVINLSAHELAAKMAYFLTGAPPDATLRGLAQSGEILNPAILDQQAERLLASSQAREVVARLFRESYGYDIFANFSYPDFFLSGVSVNGLQDAMTAELDQFFAAEVIDQNGSFAQLMTSRRANIANASLRQIYGAGAGQGAVVLPVERSGFLNRAAMLAKRGGLKASPIKRGLKVLENVLCTNVGLPPPSAPTALPEPSNELLSTRVLAHAFTEAPGSTCVTCHGRINPLGYAFEGFDTLGRLRNAETLYNLNNQVLGQVPVNTQASSSELGRTAQTFANSVQLSEQIGQSDRAMMCLVRHLKAFESKRQVSSADNCQMNEALDALYGGGNQQQGRIKDAIKAIILSDQFRQWTY